MDSHHWVVLVYKVPSEPTKYRATVWREIKRLGGIYLQNGVCIFPEIDDVALNVSALASEIRTMNGSEYMFFTESPTRAQTVEIVELFQEARRLEYDEIAKELAQLNQRTEKIKTQAHIQTLFEEIKKLRKQIGIVRGRDYFNAPEGRSVVAAAQDLQARLQVLRKEV